MKSVEVLGGNLIAKAFPHEPHALHVNALGPQMLV